MNHDSYSMNRLQAWRTKEQIFNLQATRQGQDYSECSHQLAGQFPSFHEKHITQLCEQHLLSFPCVPGDLCRKCLTVEDLWDPWFWEAQRNFTRKAYENL